MVVVQPPTEEIRLPSSPARLPFSSGRGSVADTILRLRSNRRYSAAACLRLSDPLDPSRLVLRRDGADGLVRDLVLEGRLGPRARWLGHWVIRIDALASRTGRTTDLILCFRRTPGNIAAIGRLLDDGAEAIRIPAY